MSQSAECREVLLRICAEAGKRKSSPFCKAVAKHLENCEACRAEAATLRGTLELYWCLDRRDLPEEVAGRLRSTLGLASDQPPLKNS